jgi:WD40 repeat protein
MIDLNNRNSPDPAHSNTINSISYTPDGKYIVSASEDTTVKVWEADPCKLRHTFYAVEGGKPLSIDISADGIYVAIAYGPDERYYTEGTRFCPGAVIIREIESGKTVTILKGHCYGVNATAFSPDGRQLLSASHYRDKSPIILWDLKRKRRMRIYEPFCSRIRFVSFLPDGKHFIAVDKFGDIALIDVNSGEIIRYQEDTIEHYFSPTFVTLSPDRKKILLGSDTSDEYMIWDIESGQEEWVNMPGGILSFALDPGGFVLRSRYCPGRPFL